MKKNELIRVGFIPYKGPIEIQWRSIPLKNGSEEDFEKLKKKVDQDAKVRYITSYYSHKEKKGIIFST